MLTVRTAGTVYIWLSVIAQNTVYIEIHILLIEGDLIFPPRTNYQGLYPQKKEELLASIHDLHFQDDGGSAVKNNI